MDEEEAARQLRGLLDAAQSRFQRPESERWNVPPRTSLAADDIRSHPFNVSHAVQNAAGAAEDHLQAMRGLLIDADQLPVFAGASLARASLEIASAGLWILDPPSRKERVSRCLRWHAQNTIDAESFESTLGYTGDTSARRDLVKATAERLEIDLPKNWRLFSTEVVKGADLAMQRAGGADPGALDVLTMWKAASGFAHGRQWAMFGLLDHNQAESSAPGVQVREVTARIDVLLSFTLPAHLILERIEQLWAERTTSHRDARPG